MTDGRFRRVVRRDVHDNIYFVTHVNRKYRRAWLLTWVDWARQQDFVKIELGAEA